MKNKTNSILVEPILENFRKLEINYKNLDFVKLENSAISIKNDVLFLIDSKYLNLNEDIYQLSLLLIKNI